MFLIVAFFLLAQFTGNWYLTDRLGSVTGMIDAMGALINTTQYDSYGHILSQSNPAVADQLGFTGREYDAETGLYYFRARYYNPDLGRFQSEDPIGLTGGDYNISRYVVNNPINHNDPIGLSPTIATRTINVTNLGVVQEEGETALAFGRRVHQVIQALAKLANPNFEAEADFGEFGRADLFSEEDNLIIEIKPFNTAGANAGYNQLISYYGGVLNEDLADATTEYTLRILLYF
jgi:RHS repeat-associated protein